MIKIELTESQQALFSGGNIIIDKDNNSYHFYPKIIKKIGQEWFILENEEIPNDTILESCHKDNLIISKEEYIKLINDSNFLRCLESAGVDNWDGYDIAGENYEEIEKI